MKTVRYGFFFSIVLFLYSQLIFADNFPGSKTVVAYVQPNQGNPYYAYGTFGIDIGKKYVSEAQETETARTKFSFDLTSIPENATINSVDLNYTISNYENGSYHFIMTQIGNYNSPQEIYQNIEQAAVLFADVLYNSGSLNSGTLTSLVNSSKGSILYLGGLSQNESNLDSWANLDITLSISFSIPPVAVTITTDNNFNAPGGTNHGVIEVDGDDQNAPWSFDKNVGLSTTLRALRQSDEQGYVRDWNNAYPNLQSKWEKILLGVTTNKGNSNPYNFTTAADDDGSTYKANLRIRYQISRNDQTEFDDVIPEGVQAEIFEQNSGDITAPATLTPGSITYNFAGWTDDFFESNPRTIWPTDNETFTALYKYKHHSNDVEAYKYGSQRKFVQTPDGTMHIVYESMDYIWYEISTDGGSTWRIMNDGKPLNTDVAKKPSMDYHGNVVVIVYQQNHSGYYDIMLSTFYASGNDYVLGQNTLVNYDQYDTYSSDANPVIGWGYNGRAIIVWAGAYDGPFNPIDALIYKYCAVSSTGFSVYEAGSVLNSTEKSTNPTVYYNEYAYSTYNFHLAWEEQSTSSTSKIYYQRLYPDGSDEIQFADLYEASYGSGYSKNYSPAIVSNDFQNIGGRSEDIRLSWIGYRDVQKEKELEKGNAASTGETRVLHKHKSFSSWSGLSVFGNNVEGMSQNHGDDIISNYQAYSLAWSEVSGSSVTNKFVRAHGTTTIRTLNTDGKQIQVNNSTDYDDMYVNSFQNSTSPYSFDLSENLSAELSKETSLAISQGREGVVVKDDAEFYFAIGDIILDGVNVAFVDFDDSLSIEDQEMLNEYLQSSSFAVGDNSSLTYGVQYGIVDSLLAVNALSDGNVINFKVQLIDDQTGEIIGLFDNITFSQDNVFQYNNIGYQVDMSGIGNRTVHFELVVETEAECDFLLSKRFADEVILGKSGYKQVKYQGSLAVTEYTVEQNFPNPFNPSTTIRYQIPQNGFVTLKVYDILGKEVVTLVSEEKTSGRYEVNFNATSLASGVYLYRLNVNDYVDVKKMLLLK